MIRLLAHYFPPTLVISLSLFHNLSVYRRSGLVMGEGGTEGGRRGAKSYDRDKAWPSLINSILSGDNQCCRGESAFCGYEPLAEFCSSGPVKPFRIPVGTWYSIPWVGFTTIVPRPCAGTFQAPLSRPYFLSTVHSQTLTFLIFCHFFKAKIGGKQKCAPEKRHGRNDQLIFLVCF
jgi:hypothetical protein